MSSDTHAAALTSATSLLKVEQLSLQGPSGNAILNQVSFELAAGQVLALVGESGSGKTMAARAILRLLPTGVATSAGRIVYDGQEVATLGDEAMRRLRGSAVGMVFQEPMVSLNPNMTIGAQLMEGLLLHEQLKPDAARARAVDMLKRVQIADPESCLASYPHQFSGGMRQRIMLASVMLLKPKLLIADEPTTALDSLSQREVMEIMAGLTRTMGTAVLLVTHDLHLVERYADHVVVLQRGKLIEAGPTEQVLHQPREAYTRALIDALPQRVDRPPVPEREPLIEARGLSVAYAGKAGLFSSKRSADKLAVDAMSLVIKPGEVVAVVGGSGSGKTSFGRALIGLLQPSGGELLYRNQPLSSANAALKRAYRLDCQMVFQDPYSSLDPRQRVADIVAEPLRHSADKLSKDQVRQRVAEMLVEVGLEGFGQRYPHALSGGQRQRVAIARALIRRPALVVADEPVSALDVTIQKQILTLFQRLQAHHGFACLFISHNLAVVSAIADRIVVMHKGKVIEQGSVADIFDRPQQDYTKALLDAAFGAGANVNFGAGALASTASAGSGASAVSSAAGLSPA
jgi:peptide/nickel transport system ATP-binding protein